MQPPDALDLLTNSRLDTATDLVASRLDRDSSYEYEVHLDGVRVWPAAGQTFPPSRIRLVSAEGQKRLVFGSCRITRPHEPPFTLRGHQHPDGQGIDALRGFALELARSEGADRPDLLLMLGDQIYADQPSSALQDRISARRNRPRARGRARRLRGIRDVLRGGVERSAGALAALD